MNKESPYPHSSCDVQLDPEQNKASGGLRVKGLPGAIPSGAGDTGSSPCSRLGAAWSCSAAPNTRQGPPDTMGASSQIAAVVPWAGTTVLELCMILRHQYQNSPDPLKIRRGSLHGSSSSLHGYGAALQSQTPGAAPKLLSAQRLAIQHQNQPGPLPPELWASPAAPLNGQEPPRHRPPHWNPLSNTSDGAKMLEWGVQPLSNVQAVPFYIKK